MLFIRFILSTWFSAEIIDAFSQWITSKSSQIGIRLNKYVIKKLCINTALFFLFQLLWS